MTEKQKLKTLKDLRLTTKEFFSVNDEHGDNISSQLDKIKQESINWVKNKNCDADDWRDFFNLTEEERI